MPRRTQRTIDSPWRAIDPVTVTRKQFGKTNYIDVWDEHGFCSENKRIPRTTADIADPLRHFTSYKLTIDIRIIWYKYIYLRVSISLVFYIDIFIKHLRKCLFTNTRMFLWKHFTIYPYQSCKPDNVLAQSPNVFGHLLFVPLVRMLLVSYKVFIYHQLNSSIAISPHETSYGGPVSKHNLRWAHTLTIVYHSPINDIALHTSTMSALLEQHTSADVPLCSSLPAIEFL